MPSRRRALLALRPRLLEGGELVEALRRMTAELTADTSLHVEVSTRGSRMHLPEEVQDGLLRIAQEALNNAVRHARATRVTVNLVCTPTAVRLAIQDDGCGFEPSEGAAASSLGLAIMRERAERLGGKVVVSSHREKGTRVEARVRVSHAQPGPGGRGKH